MSVRSGTAFHLLILAVLVSAMSSSHALASTGEVKYVPMLSCSGLPCVEATLAQGRHVKFLIDTGNVDSMLDRSVADAMKLELRPLPGPDGKPYPGYMQTAMKDVRIGSIALGNINLVVADLQSDIANGTVPKADGTLAYTAFRDRLLVLDYMHHRVGISQVLTANVPCPGFCGELSTPTFGKHGPPIVVTTGFQVNSRPITAQIDTLYSGTLLIYPTSVKKLGLDAQAASAKVRRFNFTDGGVDMREGIAQSESFGAAPLRRDVAVYFATPKVHLPDGMFDGTVGHELFEGRILSFDFHSRHFWVE